MLATVGVEPSSENWISQCKRFVETPQVLAMDISGSMQTRDGRIVSPSPSKRALNFIATIINKLAACFEYRGVDCIVFSNKIRKAKCHSREEALGFFNFYALKGGGTDFDALFDDLIKNYCYENPISNLVPRVTIISDFDTQMNFLALTKGVRMSFQCLNVGHTTDLQKFVDEGARWYNNDAKVLFDQHIDKMSVDNDTSKLTTKREFNHSLQQKYEFRQSAMDVDGVKITKGLKRKYITIKREYEPDIHLVEQNIETWLPLLKRRKIVVSGSVEL